MAQSKRSARDNWCMLALLVGLTVAFLLVVYLPHKRAMRAIAQDQDLKKLVVAQGNQTTDQLLATQEQIRQTREFVAGWQKSAASTGGASALLGDVSSLAKVAGVRTTRFEPAVIVEQQQLRQTPLAIGCTGTFGQIYQLLLGIEKLPQTVWVEDLKIERKERKKGDLQCELKLVIFADKSKISD